ncbi:Pheromone B beta 1 receptor [Ceratobasidium theobromae]|uniref:Pheromone B beta 1 receptor n=1 Tax=Ceratobasidium theobromae TaxID=1582974 RepID=A0A5N5QDS8_9AGAM|nr:Pheromone B beta 1 receptor [Ceratobasidium theobromae]
MGVEMPIISFICVILILILVPLYWRSSNVAVISGIAWLISCNIIRGIDTAIWMGSTAVKYKIWCDISSRLGVGANFGLPASVFCICRFLAQVASPRSSILSASEKRYRTIFELVMCVGLPIVMAGLYYIVQPNRFDVYEDFGCDVSYVPSILAIFIVAIPPVIISLGALVYAGISLHGLIHHRTRVQEVLQTSQSGITTVIYSRFIIFSIIQIIYTTAISLFIFISSIIPGLEPWSGWDNMHANWQHIDQYARADTSRACWNIDLMTWYTLPLSSILFFAFFGLAQAARMEYIKFFRWVFRVKPKPDLTSIASAPRIRAQGPYTISLSLGSLPVVVMQTEMTAPATVQETSDNMPPLAHTGSQLPCSTNQYDQSGPDAQV